MLGEQLATTSTEERGVWVGRIHDPAVFSHRLGEQSCEIWIGDGGYIKLELLEDGISYLVC